MTTFCFDISVTRIGCNNILTRQYNWAISTHKLLQNDDHKAQSGFSTRAPIKISKKNLFMPVRLCSNSRNPVTVKDIIEDLKSVKKSPIPALVLGFGGLIPFVSVPFSMISTGTFTLSLVQTQIVYGACILAFIGGIRWGLVMPANSSVSADWKNLTYGVLPSLLATVAPLLSPAKGLSLLIVGLITVAVWDKRLGGYPAWFLGMRFILTFVACLSLLSSFVLIKLSGQRPNQKSAVV